MGRTRVLLVRLGNRNITNFHVTPPMGILYLAAYLRERFPVDLRIIDQGVENLTVDQVAKEALAFEADIVGLSSLTPLAYMLPSMTEKIRENLPQSLIVLGGAHVSAFRERAMPDVTADLGVVGEGERALEQIVAAYRDGGDYSDIPGVIRKEKDGEVITNPGQMPFVEELDSLPMPAYDLVDITNYWKCKSFGYMPDRHYISLMSSRGCPYQCNYCHQVFGKRFRAHSTDRIIEEIDHFVREYGVDDVEFIDDCFNHDYDRVLEFCEQVKERNFNLKLSFPNGFRSDAMSEELIDELVDCGMYYAAYALESGTPRIQKLMGKNLLIPGFLDSVAHAVKRGVFTIGYAMLGFPTETEEEIRETVRVMCDSKLHLGMFFTVTPFPGTPLYRQVEETHPEKLEGICYDDGTYGQIQVNLSEVSTDVLFRYQRQANRKFYGRPSRVWRILRDHPDPRYLTRFIPVFIERATKGLLGRKAS